MKEAYDTSELARKPPKNAKVSAFDQWAAFKRNEPERWEAEWIACNPSYLAKKQQRIVQRSRRLEPDLILLRTDYDPPHANGAARIQLLTVAEYEEIVVL